MLSIHWYILCNLGQYNRFIQLITIIVLCIINNCNMCNRATVHFLLINVMFI